jgi:high-affinity nickel-transport protein
MLRVYGWAFVEPRRKRYYNLALTFVSTVLALAIGLIGVVGALGKHGSVPGFAWFDAAAIQEKYGELGCITVAVLLSSWLLSMLFFRSKPALQH